MLTPFHESKIQSCRSDFHTDPKAAYHSSRWLDHDVRTHAGMATSHGRGLSGKAMAS